MTTKEFILVPQSSKDFAGLENIYGYVLYNQADTIEIKNFTTYLPLPHTIKAFKIAALIKHDYNELKENLGVIVIMKGNEIVDYYYY